jgi:hypothetical protein
MKQINTIKLVFLILLGLLLTGLSAYSQMPKTISYQGVLTDTSNNPVPDGNYNLTFKLYDVTTGGTALWSEGQLVSVNKGIFSVILGSVAPLNLPFNKPYYLGVTVGAGTELSPRMPLTSSGYSFRAAKTDSISGITAGGDLAGTYPNPAIAASAVNTTKLADNSVTTSKIQNFAVTLGKLDTSGASNGQVITYTGGGISWQTPPGGGLSLPYSGSGNAGGVGQAALSITNSAASGSNYGIAGYANNNASGIGVFGQASTGVYGITSDSLGKGVSGLSTAGGVGVWGGSNGANGIGVHGSGNARGVEGISNNGYGVYGQSASTSGTGVYGKATSLTGYNTGVTGFSQSSNGVGVYGTVTGDGLKYGVLGENNSSTFGAAGVRGYAYGNGQVIGVVAPKWQHAAMILIRCGTSSCK